MSQEKQSNDTEEKTPTAIELTDEVVETTHSITLNGETINYTALTGRLVLKEEDEKEGAKAKASVFFIAYLVDDQDAATRPLSFSFNGGPGSSSVWLHLGLLGPKRVVMDEMGNAPPPPYRMVDNQFSLLGVSDLVFIDPVSTGYSRAVPGEKAEQFHTFEKDIKSVGEFIRLFVSRYRRWSSPKFLIGESYGTTRAAGLSGYLQNQAGMFLNGMMLISSILDFQTVFGYPDNNSGNDLPPVLFLPTYTATAWYHNQLDEDLQADLRSTLDEVEAFAEGEYAAALMKGDKLPDMERRALAAKLARYTGLSIRYIESTNLRINIHRFVKQLMRDEHLTIGRLDTRFQGIDRDSAGEAHSHDPSYTNIQGCYTACMNDYVRGDLNFESDLPYEILTGKVRPWNYKPFENRYVNVAETLRDAISRNPDLRVFVANGYYDLATPYFATEYTFNHLGLAPSLRDNVSMSYYEAGHMMYVHLPSLEQLARDLVTFVQTASPQE